MYRRIKHLRIGLLTLVVLLCAIAQTGEYKLKSITKNPYDGDVAYSGGGSSGSFEYGGTASGYGGTWGENSVSMTCTGTVTTVWVWHKGDIPGTSIEDPLDTPPAEVILMETCTAEYSALYLVGDVIGDMECDNGIGFESDDTGPIPIWIPAPPTWPPMPPVLYGYSQHGISEGIRYKKITGTNEIIVHVTPFAKAVTTSGLAETEVKYTNLIIVPKVTLTGTTRFTNTTPHSLKVITGQQLTVEVSLDYGSEPLPQDVDPLIFSTFTWTVDDIVEAIKNYVFTNTKGEVEPLEASDKDGYQFSFYTQKGATADASCALVVSQPQDTIFAGGLPNIDAGSNVFTSVRPTFEDWDVIDGEVGLQSGYIAYHEDPNNSLSTNGQTWLNAEYKVPDGFGDVGEGGFVQLITADRNLYRNVPLGSISHFIKYPWNAQQALDDGAPYPHGSVWSLPAKGTGVDTPLQPLSWNNPPYAYTNDDWYHSTASDTFETWGMYRPPAVGSQGIIWIPMARYTWRWSGSATKNAQGVWSLNPSLNPSGNYGQPVGWTTFPEWSKFSPSPFGFIGVP